MTQLASFFWAISLFFNDLHFQSDTTCVILLLPAPVHELGRRVARKKASPRVSRFRVVSAT
ncbi:hypothetical protein SBA4_3210004 [Candidatus Sulfopaludibacter sp. SbA4]|nr:hypothetical protein SBA4_3210004 [Candidatus Sulfopaludibacter sp. SbA4]